MVRTNLQIITPLTAMMHGLPGQPERQLLRNSIRHGITGGSSGIQDRENIPFLLSVSWNDFASSSSLCLL